MLKKQKCLNLGPKMPYLGIFGQGFDKKKLSYFKSVPSNLSNWKISWNNKNAWFWGQKSLMWVIWASILSKLLSYLKSTSSNLPNCKICWKTTMAKFGTKNTLFRYFWAGVWQKKLSYFKSVPSNLSNWKISRNNKNA